ncbi:unnamed protein product [Trifolium pratense]|uniref:Uncharacterized protein n=1 Tax=Trifolium pratense TaxID=57577 RepID=A0ACB0JAM5_TRIPR|nr:unnamed protein product [Trifolium pratense]
MDSPEEDHLKIAKKLESRKLAKINFNPTRIADLDTLLCDTYDRLSPKEVHYNSRRELIRIFNMMAEEIYGKSAFSPVVEEYGSFVMDIFNEGSDLDLSINFSDPVEMSRQNKIETLRRFGRKLRSIQKSGHVTALEVIVSAKVPIIKVTDTGTGIECDLSVENWDGIAKSHIIRAISAIDERFQKLCLLTRNPPILPPFSALLKEGANIESVKENVKTYTNYGNKNKESLAKLFVTLLVKLASAKILWPNGYWTSSYTGSWIFKESLKRPYSMSVEDFTDRSENVARAVRDKGFQTIYKCIQNSIDYLSRFLNSEIQGIELMDHLFGKPKVSTLGVEGVSTLGVEGTSTSNINEKKNNPPALQNPHPSIKKMRHFRPSKPEGTGQLHVPPSSNVPNGLPSMVSTLGVEGTSTSNINENKNNPPTLQNPRPPKKKRLVKKKVRDLQRTEPSGTAQVHVPPSSNPHTSQTPRPQKKTHLVNNQVRDLQRTGPSGTAQVHVPPRSNPPTFQNSYPLENRYLVNNHVRDFQQTEPWGTGLVHVPRSSNVPNGLPSFSPQLPYQSRYQSPFATHSSNFEHHNYVPRNVPPPFGLNPVVSQGSYNPSVPSHHGFVQTFHQGAVYHPTNPYHGSFPHSTLQGRDYASLQARDYALYHPRRG